MNHTSYLNHSKFQQINTPKIFCQQLTNNYDESKSKQQILKQLSKVDEQQQSQQFRIYQMYEVNPIPNHFNSSVCDATNTTFSQINEQNASLLASSLQNVSSVCLGIPKSNSLTDSFLRSTLGCEQKLAKSYLQILDKSQMQQEIQKQKQIEQAKKKYKQSNNYQDINANSKQFTDKIIYKKYIQKTSPVVDNQHDSYLKTQLIYINNPNIYKKIYQKQCYNKQNQNIAKKITQIGGMQDTISKMQQSLSKNQINNFNQRSSFSSPFKKSNLSLNKKNYKDNSKNWVDRSKSIREALIAKFDIR